MNARIAFSSAMLAFALLVPACGSLAGNTSTPPTLATLNGQVTNSAAIMTNGNVRIAVVWLGLTDGQFNVAEDLPVQPVFPAAFRIDFDGPPPMQSMLNPSMQNGTGTVPATPVNEGSSSPSSPSGNDPLGSMQNPPADFAYAFGTVVAYVDVNGNGKLDLVTEDAGTYIDQIVGANSNLGIVYTQGTIPTDPNEGSRDSPGNLPSLGYNLLQIMECDVMLPAMGQPSPPPCDSMLWLPMSTLYALPLSASPEVNQLMCQSVVQSSGTDSENPSMGPSVQPAQYPAPGAVGLDCAADGSSYEYTQCTTVTAGFCKGAQENCVSSEYSRPSPVPSGWPCPS